MTTTVGLLATSALSVWLLVVCREVRDASRARILQREALR